MSTDFIRMFFERIEYQDWPLSLAETKKILHYTIRYLFLNFVPPVNIIIVSRKYMKAINDEIYPYKKESDVLALPLYFVNSQNPLCGEIYLNYFQIRQQAIDLNHSWKREASFLLLHGFLHLLNYEHHSEIGKLIMFGLTREILDNLKIYQE